MFIELSNAPEKPNKSSLDFIIRVMSLKEWVVTLPVALTMVHL